MRRNPNQSRWLIRTYDRSGNDVGRKVLTSTRPAAMQTLARMTSAHPAELGFLYSADARGQATKAPVARAQRHTGVDVWDEATRSTREYRFSP